MCFTLLALLNREEKLKLLDYLSIAAIAILLSVVAAILILANTGGTR